MAEPKNKTHQTNLKSNRFLSCFGFYGKKNSLEKPIKTRIKKGSPSFSWSMFCFSSKKFRTKTVPVDNSEKGDFGCESKTTSKLIKKKLSDSKPQTQSPTNYNKSSRQNSKADGQLSSLNKSSRTKPKEGPEPNILLGNKKLLDRTRTGSSLSTPAVKPKTNPKTHSKLSHSVSLPVLQGNQRVGNPRTNDRVNSIQHKRRNNVVVEKFDSVMGLSIIMVTLVIMLLWGQLCAILCTSTWFYFRSRFRTVINDNSIKSIADSNDKDLNSGEYKKKIVLEGLLERNRKVTL